MTQTAVPPKPVRLALEPPGVPADDPAAAVQERARLRLRVAQLERELGDVRANARDTKRRQMQFLISVAQELRNALVPMRAAARPMALGYPGDEAFASLQATLGTQVARMSRLVGDLLDGARLGAGCFRLERTKVDACGILQLAVETCQAEIDARGQVLTCTLPPAPVHVLGDAARLVQVFCNLLQNSSRYSARGGRISLQALVHGSALAVTVADEGIGIPAAALPDVFDIFARDALAASIHPGGLGIGLAIVDALVRAHEGSVAVHSAGEGRGCVMVVSLPVQLPRPPNPPEEPGP